MYTTCGHVMYITCAHVMYITCGHVMYTTCGHVVCRQARMWVAESNSPRCCLCIGLRLCRQGLPACGCRCAAHRSNLRQWCTADRLRQSLLRTRCCPVDTVCAYMFTPGHHFPEISQFCCICLVQTVVPMVWGHSAWSTCPVNIVSGT